MAVKSAFFYDAAGAYCFQDPDDDLDYTFDFRDEKEPALLPAENIASVLEMVLSRIDSDAITTEELHDQSSDSDEVVVWVRKLKKGVTYNLECTVRTSAAIPRDYSRSFRILCKER